MSSGNDLNGLPTESSQNSNPQTRRKRGLSLRSQLLNKALASSINPFADSRNVQPSVPLGNLSPRLEETVHESSDPGVTSESGQPPSIRVDTPSDERVLHGSSIDQRNDSASLDQKRPSFTVSNMDVSRSTTRLTSGSSDNSHDETDTPRARKYRTRRRARDTYLSFLVRFKEKVLGKSNLGRTDAGRVIPLCIAKEKANIIFNDQFYDAHHGGFIDERTTDVYCSNIITSSRYTVYSFFPKQLRAQFSKLANCYFMVVAIMQMIPSWSTTGKFTTIIPLMIFMSISMAREALDDWKRHTQDKEENNKETRVVKEDADLATLDTHSIATIMTETIPVPNMGGPDSSGSSIDDLSNNMFSNTSLMNRYNINVSPTKWKDVQVGDIILVKEDEWIPADIVLLAVNTHGTDAYVETMALDGETNLKTKSPHPELSTRSSKVTSLKNLSSLLTVEDPNPDLYNFEGHFNIEGQTYALGTENVIYRGSILRNTRSILGVVVFSGEESKIRMNNVRNPRTKAPKLQGNINYIVLFMVFVVISLSAFSLMAQRLLYNRNKNSMWYTYQEDVGVAATFMGFVIMYNTLIPLSLYVTMEIIKVMQLLFLQFDIDMYHVESNTPADAKTATILEELGQVSYIFSDKTGTLTDNKMVFRKFSVCGTNWLHEVDLLAKVKQGPGSGEYFSKIFPSSSIQSGQSSPRNSTNIVRESMELANLDAESTWKSPAQPLKVQEESNSLYLLKHIQSNPHTLFSKKVTFFLLSIALCHTCQPRTETPDSSRNVSSYSLDDFEHDTPNDIDTDSSVAYQAASPDELALVNAARDLGFIVVDKKNNCLQLKTYPNGFGAIPVFEEYQILDVIEFTSSRKRMSVVIRFPDSRIGVFCKGADNVILENLRNADLAKQKARDIALLSNDRKTLEAEVVLQTKLSNELESRKSTSSIRGSIDFAQRLGSIDGIVSKESQDLHDIAVKARDTLHSHQAKRYSLDSLKTNGPKNISSIIPNDKTLVNEEYIIEKTLEHIESFSTEGLRTLLYSFKWVSNTEYDEWARDFHEAKTALYDRASKVEITGSRIETNLSLLGATAIEDKLQEGVSDTIEKLRRAGIKMWMLTGDKRETAINIGYSCRLIKDYSSVIILTIDEGLDRMTQKIKTASDDITAGRIAHSVVVIDGSTLSSIQANEALLSIYIELCIQVDSAICCRASPSQKAEMVEYVRKIKTKDVTLAIGDGANDIAMIQSADIGVGITGKEGLQAARSADYAIAQFRFLLKLLLVNGRYNYIRTSKFVLSTFYKELLFYLTQCIYQRYTIFTGSSLYESWSLSMFNTLFTSLAVICIGMFEKDLNASTLLAVPELYSTGRLYKAFNLRVFLRWMILAAVQSVAISFLAYESWGFSGLRDNTTLPLGTAMFWAIVIVINAKIQFLEMHNIQWLAPASFFISVLGYGLWNVLIMSLNRSKPQSIFYVDYGLLEFGRDYTWWATVLMLFTVLLLLDLLVKVVKFVFAPSDTEIFQLFEKDLNMRRTFEENSLTELSQGWFFERDASTTRSKILSLFKIFGLKHDSKLSEAVQDENLGSAVYRKRAGTRALDTELPPSSEGYAITEADYETPQMDGYEILPSGARMKLKTSGVIGRLGKRLRRENDVDADEIIDERFRNLEESHRRI